MTALADLRDHYGVREWGARAPLAVRLFRRVEQVDDCWIWQGALAAGYGRIAIKGRRPLGLTHRLAYELLVGPIPDAGRCCGRWGLASPVRPGVLSRQGRGAAAPDPSERAADLVSGAVTAVVLFACVAGGLLGLWAS